MEITEVDEARGTLREALSALRNFAELLHSVRVASKALTAVLPDVAASIAPMTTVTERLLDMTARHPPLLDASAALRTYFAPRLTALERELLTAGERPLGTRTRLALEQTVTRSSLELDTARGLLELLIESAVGRLQRLNLVELVQHGFTAPASVGAWDRGQIRATLAASGGPFSQREVQANARVVIALLVLGVELVAGGGTGAPHIAVAESAASCRVRIARAPTTPGDELVLVARGVIEPTLTCMRAAARCSDFDFAWDEPSPSLELCFRPSP